MVEESTIAYFKINLIFHMNITNKENNFFLFDLLSFFINVLDIHFNLVYILVCKQQIV